MGDTQWEKLDGSAYLVRSKGEKYQRIAEAISRASASLQNIVDDTNTTAKSMRLGSTGSHTKDSSAAPMTHTTRPPPSEHGRWRTYRPTNPTANAG
jgi:hypothetical protein